MVKEVWPWMAMGLGLTLALAGFGHGVPSIMAGLATLAVASFFRDPRRAIPLDPDHILSPADGRVVGISSSGSEQPEGTCCVSIFLSVFNVHVNRAPVAGRVEAIRYSPGAFMPAFREKASALNEQNLIIMETSRGPLAVKQIAGLIARRIRCWKGVGDRVAQGDKIGFITFGSRVDIFVPAAARLRVVVGDRVRGGLSVIAAWPGSGEKR